jgi:limonene-1,2-epoxide hydrolase
MKYRAVCEARERQRSGSGTGGGATHANTEAVDFVSRFLAAKSASDLDAILPFISADAAVFADVPLGWELGGHRALQAAWGRHIPSWGPGKFSLDCVLGEIHDGLGSVMLGVTNTPSAFHVRMQVLSAVDVRDGKITRWIDYWDGACFDVDLYSRLRSPRPCRPQAIRSGDCCSSRRIREVSGRLVDLLSRGEAQDAGRLFGLDACYEDRGLHTRLRGRGVISGYLSRVVGALPLGRRVRLGHVVGGEWGGGFEWVASAASPVNTGAAALMLGSDGLISRVSVVYDTRDLPDCYRDALQCHADDLLD